MKLRLNLFNIGAILAAILLASIAVLFAGQTAANAWPSMTSPRPSGTMAFAELLRREGYEVVLDRSNQPKLGKDDIAVAFTIAGSSDVENAFTQMDEDSGVSVGRGDDFTIGGALEKHVESGGSVLYVPMPQLFDVESQGLRDSATLTDDKGRKYTARWENYERSEDARPSWSEGDLEVELWTDDSELPLISLGVKKQGRIGVIGDGLMASNRYLDKEDHASLLLDTMSRLGKPGARVVFTEAVFGNIETKSLFGTLGSWANAARWQTVLLALVIIFTLGRRFGEPEVEIAAPKGARDMLTALSASMRRGKRQHLAIYALYDDALAQCRKIIRASRHTKDEDVIAALPIELQTILKQIFLNQWKDPVQAAKTLEYELAKFKNDSRRDRPRA